MHRKRIFFRSVQKYYYHVQKNCLFLGPCRNITIQGQGVPGVSCRAIFGVREEVLIFGEIFTSGLGSSPAGLAAVRVTPNDCNQAGQGSFIKGAAKSQRTAASFAAECRLVSAVSSR